MTTPKEALRIARGYIVDDIKRKPSEYDPAGDLKKIDEALASLEGDAVERVARLIEPYCPKAHVQYKAAVVLAERILATGLVAGEAAIRADEREKCEHRVEELDCLYINDERCPFGGIPADPETSIRREAIKECLAAIRSGDVA